MIRQEILNIETRPQVREPGRSSQPGLGSTILLFWKCKSVHLEDILQNLTPSPSPSLNPGRDSKSSWVREEDLKMYFTFVTK